jgi:hypothetical protein
MFYVSPLCDAAHVKPIIHFRPYPPQHLTIDSCDTQAPVTLKFFIPLLYAVLHRRVLSKLGSKTSLHRHDVRAYSSTQNDFSVRVAIFTQSAPLAATDVTKHPRQVQTTWTVSLSIGMLNVTILCAIQVYQFFCNVPGNYE